VDNQSAFWTSGHFIPNPYMYAERRFQLSSISVLTHNGNGCYGTEERQRHDGTAKRQRQNGNGMVETRH